MYVHCVAVVEVGDVDKIRSILKATEDNSRDIVTKMADEIEKKPDTVNSKCSRHQYHDQYYYNIIQFNDFLISYTVRKN